MTKEINKKTTNKKWIKWVLIGLLVLAVVVGFKIYKDRKVLADRRYLMEKQRELMIESWQEEGLTEEEIKERMDAMSERRMDMRGSRGNDDSERERPEGGMDVMRMGRMMK